MPRLFTGLEIPDDVAQRLSLLRGGLPGARWIDAESYHVTLRFIGDIDGPTAVEVADALSRIDRDSLTLTIDGLDAFGSKKPHALVARIAGGRALIELQAEQERIIQRLGLPAETRKFTPHVTLARLRGTSNRDVAEYLALRGGFSAGPFRADRFVLYSSRDSVGGGPYLVEEAYPLARQGLQRAAGG
jgi:2'-5' RNA ligase